MLTRRSMLLTPLAASLARVATAQSADPGKMLLAMHQNTSSGAGFRGSLEGWSRAGIRYVELGSPQLQGFLENDTLPAARRLLEDLDLTPVSAAVVLQDIWLPGPARAESLEAWRRGCDQFANLGLHADLLALGHQSAGHRRRLRRDPGLHRRGGRHRGRVRPDHDDRVHAHVDASVDTYLVAGR